MSILTLFGKGQNPLGNFMPKMMDAVLNQFGGEKGLKEKAAIMIDDYANKYLNELYLNNPLLDDEDEHVVMICKRQDDVLLIPCTIGVDTNIDTEPQVIVHRTFEPISVNSLIQGMDIKTMLAEPTRTDAEIEAEMNNMFDDDNLPLDDADFDPEQETERE